MAHDESKLPLWAQERLAAARREVGRISGELERLRTAHSLLEDGKDWFTLPGPSSAGADHFTRLWYMAKDDPRPICALGKGDVLLVGRSKNSF